MKNNVKLPEMLTLDTRSSIERLLAFSIGEDKSKKCISRLFERYGSLATAVSENEEELCRALDVSMNTALLLKLVAYLDGRRVTDSFRYGEEHTELELRELIASLFIGASVEMAYVILLDDCGRVISWERVSEGTVNASDIVPRKVLDLARKKKSKSIILAHNHPKGTSSPSKDDIMTTGRLFNLFASVGVRLVAHYIVADGEVGRIESDMLYNPDFKG